jgi:hypothetical protein
MPATLPSRNEMRPFGDAGWLELLLILFGVALALLLLPLGGAGN